jgi:hypothetical protein
MASRIPDCSDDEAPPLKLKSVFTAKRSPSSPFNVSRYSGKGQVLPMETRQLIQPASVVRDGYGMFQHPDMPDFDEGDEEKCKQWIGEQGLSVAMVSLEYADEAIAERYFESGDPDCTYWEPDRPDGEGWFCLAIHDTDNGPVCWWARREVTP